MGLVHLPKATLKKINEINPGSPKAINGLSKQTIILVGDSLHQQFQGTNIS